MGATAINQQTLIGAKAEILFPVNHQDWGRTKNPIYMGAQLPRILLILDQVPAKYHLSSGFLSRGRYCLTILSM
jgi:hypothetical protein